MLRLITSNNNINAGVQNVPHAPQTVTLPPKQLTLRTQAQPVINLTQMTTTYPTALSYKQYDQRTHIYMKPDMYIGADDRVSRQEWLYNAEENKIVNHMIDFVPGCERIFLEIATNASDNGGRSRRNGVDPGKIEMTMDNSMITVKNFGLPIPIEIHPTEKIYVPQMIFGSTLSGSNYEVDRHEAGTNGIGAKAANIFSKFFRVIIFNHIMHLKYSQIWRENMTIREDPIIEQYDGNISSTEVSYILDFARFKYPVPNGNEGGYPAEAFALFSRIAIDLSFTSKINVSFNGKEFSHANIRDYARLYFGNAVDTALVYYQWPEGTEVIHKKKGYQISKDPAITPIIELIAIDTPDEGYHVSFANCMMTRDGGVHVNAGIKSVAEGSVKMINDDVIKQLSRGRKGKELDAKEKKSHTITINDVKPHISMLLSAKVMNPKFTSQTKTNLHSPTPKIEIPEEDLRIINNWQLIERLHAALEAKQFASNAKTDGKLKSYVRLLKGIDANFAGKANRADCCLYITEGRSGAGYANKLVTLVPGGRDKIGVLPMRGKSLNVMNANRFSIEGNSEIKELKKILGLIDCPDPVLRETYYLDPANFSKLRYGAGIMIMADSDVDGKHIIGLILNYFYCKFPSLLARGYVMFYRTPTLRVTFNRNTIKFYTQREYDEWKNATPNFQKWAHKYYKGLGTSKDAEIKDDFRTPRVVNCFYDSEAPDAMRLAFDKKRSDDRKEWIANWQPILGVDDIQMQPISWFITHELVLYSIANVQRSIPKLMDGFKESHRKIMFGAHKKWKIGSKKTNYQEVKVAQLSAYVAGESKYHHGEQILDDVVVGMAQNFMGSNNLPWFMREGQFGTRFAGGKDAAETRYSTTMPEKIVAYMFRKEDRPILKHIIDDGDTIEPENYLPVIPPALINGAYGIGTGYSTTVPNHNPLDIINWLRMRLQGVDDNDLPEVNPWYRGFTGTIKLIDRSKKRKRAKMTIITNDTEKPQITTTDHIDEPETIENETLDNEVEEEQEEDTDNAPRQLLSMVSLGKFYSQLDGTVVITELPIGRWPENYHKWLEGLVDEKKITGFRDLSGDDIVYFEIYGWNDLRNYNTLKLKRTIGMSNMVFLDENNRPRRYDTAYDILHAFYARRIVNYQERKDYIIRNITEELVKLNHKIRFIQAVISGEVMIVNRKKSTIHAAMDILGIPHEIYGGSMQLLSEDDILVLMNQLAEKQAEKTAMENSTPTELWLKDIEELEAAYRSEFGLKPPKITLTLNKPQQPVITNPFPASTRNKSLTLNLKIK